VLKAASLRLVLGVRIGGVSGIVAKDISSTQVGVYHIAEAWYKASTTDVPIWLMQCIGLVLHRDEVLFAFTFFSPPSQAEE